MSRTRSKPLLIIIRLILVGMIIFGAVGIYRVVNEVNAGKANFDSGIEAIRPAADDTELRLDLLQQINPDIQGWVMVEGTKIDFPVLMDRETHKRFFEIFERNGDLGDLREGSDKPISEILYKYLYNDYLGKPSTTGSITADVRCHEDLSGRYVVIYGHNVGWDGVMFSDLDQFKKPEFYAQHKKAVLFSAAGREDLELLSCSKISGYVDAVFSMNGFFTEEGFDISEAVLNLTNASMYPVEGPAPIDYERYIILSTCYTALHPEDPVRLVLLYRVVD